MGKPEQSTYLNDHLAGAAAALDLLDSLRDDEDPAFDQLINRLAADISSDSEVLATAMSRLAIEQETVKQAGARLGEKAMRAKSSETMTGSPALTRLQRLEALMVGINGKIAVWRSLNAADDKRLSDFDFDALIQSAENQIEHLESYRLAAAEIIFRA